eukprot:4048512-Prymnesium_polylepis.1
MLSAQNLRVALPSPAGENHPLLGCSAWMALARVRPLTEPHEHTVPPWLEEGQEVIALREPSPAQWSLATVVALRQGLRSGFAGCRIRVSFGEEDDAVRDATWLRPGDVKPVCADDE